jgi:hypothetical protein
MPRARSAQSCAVPVPSGWIELGALLAATGTDKRTLSNWRQRWLVPRPVTIPLAGGIGTASYYRPETVAIIRRVQELRRLSHDANEWLWQVWLEGYPVDITAWAKRRLDAMAALLAASCDSEVAADGILAAFDGRIRKASDGRSLLDWALSAARGGDAMGGLRGAEPPVFALLLKAAGLPDNTPLPDRELIGALSLARLSEIVSGMSEGEIAQARRDWQTIAGLVEGAALVNWDVVMPVIGTIIANTIGAAPEPPSWRARKARRKRPHSPPAIVRFLSARSRDHDFRATALAFLAVLRRSADGSKRLSEILALATMALASFPKVAP